MKSKQEVIQQHYIDLLNADKFFKLKPHIDEDGWCLMFDQRGEKVSPVFIELGFTTDPSGITVDAGNKEGCMVWRPKNLQGIETNNGWTRIESEKDFPKENGDYFVVWKAGEDVIISAVSYDIDNPEHWNGVTHYQPIVKPAAPLY